MSYGTVGNDGISSDLWSQTWTSETDLRYQYILNNQYSSSYDLSTEQMANKNLKWETTITRNFGFDFGFLKNRLWGFFGFILEYNKGFADVDFASGDYRIHIYV